MNGDLKRLDWQTRIAPREMQCYAVLVGLAVGACDDMNSGEVTYCKDIPILVGTWKAPLPKQLRSRSEGVKQRKRRGRRKETMLTSFVLKPKNYGAWGLENNLTSREDVAFWTLSSNTPMRRHTRKARHVGQGTPWSLNQEPEGLFKIGGCTFLEVPIIRMIIFAVYIRFHLFCKTEWSLCYIRGWLQFSVNSLPPLLVAAAKGPIVYKALLRRSKQTQKTFA